MYKVDDQKRRPFSFLPAVVLDSRGGGRHVLPRADAEPPLDLKLAALTLTLLRKTAFLSHLFIKTIILPRQARDKHRENSKKMAFFAPASPRRPRGSSDRGPRKRWSVLTALAAGSRARISPARSSLRASSGSSRQSRQSRQSRAGRAGRRDTR